MLHNDLIFSVAAAAQVLTKLNHCFAYVNHTSQLLIKTLTIEAMNPKGFLIFMLVSSLLALGQSQETTTLNDPSENLRNTITQQGVRKHLDAFQAIADNNNGHRSAGSTGYDASAAYVKEQLERAGYSVSVQSFDISEFLPLNVTLEQLAPDAKMYRFGPDISSMQFSGTGELKATVQAVDVQIPPTAENSSTSGCESTDFNAFQAGNIALLQRGVCTFQDKVDNALEAGAKAVIIFNEGQAGRRDLFGGTLSERSSLPVLIATYQTGKELAESEPTLELSVELNAESVSTTNIIAESQTGDPKSVIMLGAHLDSVPEGAGIHDNGSGSAATLEIALQAAKTLALNEPNNTMLKQKIRFAWWGGEELGLLGSRHYVSELSQKEQKSIQAYLNLDMIASPNYARYVYDGDESDRNSRVAIPEGSAELETQFLNYFKEQNISSSPTTIFQGSDHTPFAQAGIPIGGLYTGASEDKNRQQAQIYGGEAGEPHDACYHQACDTISNINFEVLEEMADATAHVILNLAMQELLLRR